MKRSELLPLLPRDQEDVARAVAITRLGYPAIEPVLGDLVDWLRVPGSPVDLVLRPFFASLGEPALPVVRKVLRSRHEAHRHNVLAHVVSAWPKEVVAGLRTELEAIAGGWGASGVDLIALELLMRHGLSERHWLQQWVAFKVERARHLSSMAEALRSRLDDGHSA